MEKFIPIVQIIGAVVLGIIAIAAVANLIFIIPREETISVVNAMIGLGVVIIALLAMARILLRRGLNTLRATKQADSDTGS
jgi:type IV secretory pathway VirB3-like protein